MKRLTIFLFLYLPTTLLAQHTLILKDGDILKGKVQYMDKETVTFFINDRPKDFLISDLRTLHFFDLQAEEKEAAREVKKEFKNGFNKVSYVMEGRTMTKFPKIGLGSADKGVVVVDVSIDKYGNVQRAEPGAPGTKTTNDKYLFVKAKSAVQDAKFNSDPIAPLSTSGKVWVEF